MRTHNQESIYALLSTDFPHHLKTKKLIRRTGDSGAWHLFCLMLWVTQNRTDGDLSGMTNEDIEAVSGWMGECGVFADCLMDTGWVEGGRLDTVFITPYDDPIKGLGRLCWKTWKKIREAVFERDGYRCTYCGESSPQLECDHIQPISKGGSNEMQNLATACRTCNRKKRDKTINEWLEVIKNA